MFVATAMAPATSLVSAQMRPMMVPATSRAAIAASPYTIRRLVMTPMLVPSERFSNQLRSMDDGPGLAASDVTGNVARFLGREHQAMQGRRERS